MANRLRNIIIVNKAGQTVTDQHSAAVQLEDTNRGFLPNRLTSAQRDAIASPVRSLTIFNTDHGWLEYYTGRTWEPVVDSQNNLLSNAGMEIDQAHEGTSVAYANAQNYVTDQWFLTGNPGTATGITAQRSTDAPNGFAFSELLTIGTGGTVSAGSLLLFCQRLSGDETGNLGFGTADAKYISVSFWMKSNQTGMMPFHMRHNYGGSSTYLVPFTYTTPNVWTYMSATFPGDQLHGTTVDAGNEVTIGFGLTSGATDMDTPNQWNVNTHHTIAGMWQLGAISGATLQITGVKLEASPVPTPFARRDSWSELMGCQRYYEKSYDPGIAPGTSSSLTGSEAVYVAGTNGLIRIRSKVTGAKIGTWTVYSPVTGTAAKVADITGAADVSASVTNAGVNGATVTFTAIDGHQYAVHWTHNAQL